MKQKQSKMNPQEIISFLDYTSLGENDNQQSITDFLQAIDTKYGKIAAVCIYPQFISLAKKILTPKNIPVATVVNFPTASDSINKVLNQTKIALENGADEIDVVCYWQNYLSNGQSALSSELIRRLKKLCGKKILKVILETGEIQHPQLIQKASENAILAGADFLKTSTGKTPNGADLEAVGVMLGVIRQYSKKTLPQKKIGLKISGGIKTYWQALEYIRLIEKMNLQDLLTPDLFRIGASSLLIDLLKKTHPSKII